MNVKWVAIEDILDSIHRISFITTHFILYLYFENKPMISDKLCTLSTPKSSLWS